MSSLHKIKVDPLYSKSIRDGCKTFEIRENDRDYRVGDFVVMEEYCPSSKKYLNSDRPIVGKIQYQTNYAQKEGWVVFSVELL